MRLINKKEVKKYFHEYDKRVSDEALDLIEIKLRAVLKASIRASNHFKTVKARDVSLFCIKVQI